MAGHTAAREDDTDDIVWALPTDALQREEGGEEGIYLQQSVVKKRKYPLGSKHDSYMCVRKLTLYRKIYV